MDYKLIEQQLDELNLDGYKHIKNNEWGLPDKLISWLKNHNFKKIGEGAYSSVFQSPTENFVVKVNNGEIDEGYLEFVEFCHQNKGNPHLPKIGKIKKYEDWYIVFIEKLESCNLSTTTNRWLINFIEASCNADNVIEMEEYYDEYLKPCSGFFENDNIKDQFIEIVILIQDFEKLSERGTVMDDIHAGNIMMRGDTLVITDPIAG